MLLPVLLLVLPVLVLLVLLVLLLVLLTIGISSDITDIGLPLGQQEAKVVPLEQQSSLPASGLDFLSSLIIPCLEVDWS